MKHTIQWVLLDTKLGDLALQAFERLTGLGPVHLEEIDSEQAEATAKGRAWCKSQRTN